jgi:hypothetical protein
MSSVSEIINAYYDKNNSESLIDKDEKNKLLKEIKGIDSEIKSKKVSKNEVINKFKQTKSVMDS